MGRTGIFVTVVLTSDAGDQCLKHGVRGATIDRDDGVALDGSSTNLHVFSAQGAAMMVLNTLHGGLCYQFDFITWSPQVRDANEGAAQRMLASFRFGSGPRPAA
jgi:hypothetical protein